MLYDIKISTEVENLLKSMLIIDESIVVNSNIYSYGIELKFQTDYCKDCLVLLHDNKYRFYGHNNELILEPRVDSELGYIEELQWLLGIYKNFIRDKVFVDPNYHKITKSTHKNINTIDKSTENYDKDYKRSTKSKDKSKYRVNRSDDSGLFNHINIDLPSKSKISTDEPTRRVNKNINSKGFRESNKDSSSRDFKESTSKYTKSHSSDSSDLKSKVKDYLFELIKDNTKEIPSELTKYSHKLNQYRSQVKRFIDNGINTDTLYNPLMIDQVVKNILNGN